MCVRACMHMCVIMCAEENGSQRRAIILFIKMNWNIRNWRVSFYDNNQEKWIYGRLACLSSGVSFIAALNDSDGVDSTSSKHYVQSSEDEAQDSATNKTLFIEYTEITSVKKTTSMLLFPAVVLETRGGTAYWFSSLPDQHSVYSMIHHFSHNSLLNKERVTLEPSTKTLAGQKLLKSLEDSEHTLAAAAEDLWGQGRKLARSAVMMQEMHEDLDVANRLLTSLDAWLGQWQLPPQYRHAEPVRIAKGDVLEDQDQEVLYSELHKDQWRPQRLCILRTSDSGLFFLDQHQRKIQTVTWVELSRVFVVSPWEVVVTKHVAGRASVNVSVVSTSLLPFLQLTQKRVPHLVDYQTPPSPAHPAKGALKETRSQERDLSPKMSPSVSHNKSVLKEVDCKSGSLGGDETVQDQKQEVVSDAEIQVLSSRLGVLKSLATAVGEEMTAQNEALDDLISTVDRADMRVQDANRRMQRMT